MPSDKPAAGFAPERMALYGASLLLLASLGTAVYRLAFLRRAVRVDATIVSYVQHPGGRGRGQSSSPDSGFRAVFVFRTVDGHRIQATSPESAADHVPLRPPGSVITVMYDPADLSALPDTWPALWTPTAVLAALGAALLVARFAYLAVRRRV